MMGERKGRSLMVEEKEKGMIELKGVMGCDVWELGVLGKGE